MRSFSQKDPRYRPNVWTDSAANLLDHLAYPGVGIGQLALQFSLSRFVRHRYFQPFIFV
jgi:hypothetical protein